MKQACRQQQQYSRFDTDTALVVEKGIVLQGKVGTGFAAAYLKSNRIATPVILRVLLRPAERRAVRPK